MRCFPFAHSLRGQLATSRRNVSSAGPNDPYPVLRYTITMSRATSFYDVLIIVPGILLTLLSFCVFTVGNDSNFDQLAYGISVIIVSLLSQFLVVNMVPVCGELLWIDMASITLEGAPCGRFLYSPASTRLPSANPFA